MSTMSVETAEMGRASGEPYQAVLPGFLQEDPTGRSVSLPVRFLSQDRFLLFLRDCLNSVPGSGCTNRPVHSKINIWHPDRQPLISLSIS